MGAYYRRYVRPDVRLSNLGFLSAFDFACFKGEKLDHFLEVKKKQGYFKDSELLPYNKWKFYLKCEVPCLFMVERDLEARLFDLSLLSKDTPPYEIKRRIDQPEGSKYVLFLPVSISKTVYYLNPDKWQTNILGDEEREGVDMHLWE